MTLFILALDQGTTSSRAIVFDHSGRGVATAQQEYAQILPAPGLVEHDPEAIWNSQLAVAQKALAQARLTAADVAAIGVTNQRETTILWDKVTGKPVANAVVWQSRVSAAICDRLKAKGLEQTFRAKTGLLLDAYFSGTKIKHLLDTNDGLRERAARGEILFGTVDSFLIWRLTGGQRHVTDVSNASRTLLMNIHTCQWDDELLKILDVPRAMLPEICSSSEVYGHTDSQWFGAPIPIAGDAGDQQAATFGQACFAAGDAKNTYGTGCFLLMNTGSAPKESKNNLLTTIGWQLGDQVTYCWKARCSSAARWCSGSATGWESFHRQPTYGNSQLPCQTPAASCSCRHSWDSARRIGIPTRVARCSALRAAPRRATSRERRSNRWPIKRAIFWRPCSRTPASRFQRSRSMVARPWTTHCYSSRRIFSAHPCSVLWCAKQRPWERLTWQGWRSGIGRTRVILPHIGKWTANSGPQ